MAKDNGNEVFLANNWSVSTIINCVQTKSRDQLIIFLEERFNERFFEPIRRLNFQNREGFGFAIMALCSLLIETLQSFRYGLPSTNSRELEDLQIRQMIKKMEGKRSLNSSPSTTQSSQM